MPPPAHPLRVASELRRAGRWSEALAVWASLPDEDPDAGLALAARARLHRLRGETDRVAALVTRLGMPAGPPAVRASALRLAAVLQMDEQAHDEALRLLREAQALSAAAGDTEGEVRALVEAAEVAWHVGALLRAEADARRALELAVVSGSAELVVDARNALASVRRFEGRYDEARDLYLTADVRAELADHPLGRHVAQRGLGAIAGARRDVAGTRDHHEAALRLAEALGYTEGIAWAYTGLGEAARLEGDLERAESAYDRALAVSTQGSHRVAMVVNKTLLALHRGDLAGARARVESELLALGPHIGPGWRAILHGTLLGACEAAGDDEAWAHHYTRTVALLAETGEVEPDLAECFDDAGARAEAKGALGHAARTRALAMEHWHGLGRPEEAAASTAALHRLAEAGAPIPLGPFDLVAPIGAGGMGEVWRGVHAGLGTPVAVKVLLANQAREPRHLALFRAEVRAVASLDHPAVVTVLDHGRVGVAAAQMSAGRLTEGSPFLVMELVEGGTLEDRCGTSPWAWCRQALGDVLAALAHAHARGVLHRDIKPANVLVDAEGRVRLSDFGLTAAAGVAGTPLTMAPEQIRSGGALGPPTDLYALGCLATVLVSGRWPFDEAGLQALFDAHLHATPPPLRPTIPVPDDLEAWIARLLAKAPEDRFPTAGRAASALARLGEARPQPTRPAPLPSRAATFAFLGHSAPEAGGAVTLAPIPSMPSIAQATVLHEAADEVTPFPTPRAAAVPHTPPESPEVPIPTVPPAVVRARRRLAGTGLGLLALRAPPLLGRDAERRALWERLLGVRSTGTAHVVTLTGDIGVGRSRLAAWIAEAAAEQDAAASVYALPPRVDAPTVVLLDDDDAPPSTPRGPALVVRVGDPAGGDRIDVPPLADEHLWALAVEGLGLDPGLAARVVGRARGRPQWLVQVVASWHDAGLLVAGERAFTIRGGAEPPLPDDMGAVWVARFAALVTGPARRALAVAAQLGDVVDPARWKADAGVPEGLLDRLLDAGLLRGGHPRGWRFVSRGARAAAAAPVVATPSPR